VPGSDCGIWLRRPPDLRGCGRSIAQVQPDGSPTSSTHCFPHYDAEDEPDDQTDRRNYKRERVTIPKPTEHSRDQDATDKGAENASRRVSLEKPRNDHPDWIIDLASHPRDRHVRDAHRRHEKEVLTEVNRSTSLEFVCTAHGTPFRNGPVCLPVTICARIPDFRGHDITSHGFFGQLFPSFGLRT
jgi:hypothetical protein